jgi:hypothetical protein
MITWIFKLLIVLRNIVHDFLKNTFNLLRDDYSGKIKGIDIKSLKLLLFLAALVFFATVFILAY